jgi:hypothetical protein
MVFEMQHAAILHGGDFVVMEKSFPVGRKWMNQTKL